jgi:c-di-GMP-binding flagellar brake protein YcgR
MAGLGRNPLSSRGKREPMIGNPKNLSIHDDVTVETDLDGVSVALDGFVTNVLAEELWLATRLPDERIGRLLRGQSIHLTFDRDGPVILDSMFLRRLGDTGRFDMQKSRVFAVQRPAGLESSQRRAHVRVDLERDVRIRSLAAAGGERLGTGRTINIGAGGLLFSTSMPLLFGEDLLLAIALGARNIVIAGGSVVRIEDGDLAPDEPGQDEPAPDGPSRGGPPPARTSRVAIRFDKISEADQERITCYILQIHRQRRSLAVAPIPPIAFDPDGTERPEAEREADATSDPEPAETAAVTDAAAVTEAAETAAVTDAADPEPAGDEGPAALAS